MITNNAYLLVAVVDGKRYVFEYDAIDANDNWDALEKFFHEDYPETFGNHDGSPFPIDVYALDIDGSIISVYRYVFNTAVFHAFYDHGRVASGVYTLDMFNEDIKRKERKDAYNVSSFFYYMWNDWSKEECEKVFKGCGTNWQHFWDKWCGICKEHDVWGAAERLYAALSEGNRRLLVERALEVRDGDNRIEV